MASTCRQCGPGGCMGHDAPVLIEGAPVPCGACGEPGDCGCSDGPEGAQVAPTALSRQEGGDHYRDLAVQPSEYIYRNGFDWLTANVIKYASRHKAKGGAADIRKAIHYCQLILELEYGDRG